MNKLILIPLLIAFALRPVGVVNADELTAPAAIEAPVTVEPAADTAEATATAPAATEEAPAAKDETPSLDDSNNIEMTPMVCFPADLAQQFVNAGKVVPVFTKK